MLCERSHVSSSAVALVRSEFVLRILQMHVKHVGITRCFGENGSGTYLAYVGVRAWLRNDTQAVRSCPGPQIPRNLSAVNDNVTDRLWRKQRNRTEHRQHRCLQDVELINLLRARRADCPDPGVVSDVNRKLLAFCSGQFFGVVDSSDHCPSVTQHNGRRKYGARQRSTSRFIDAAAIEHRQPLFSKQ